MKVRFVMTGEMRIDPEEYVDNPDLGPKLGDKSISAMLLFEFSRMESILDIEKLSIVEKQIETVDVPNKELID